MIQKFDSQVKVCYRNQEYYLDLSSKKEPIKLKPKHEKSTYSVCIGNELEDPYYIVYVTDTCNMQCGYCFNEIDKDKRLCNTIPNYSCSQLANYIEAQGYRKQVGIRFFGGEPLMNKKWIYDCVTEFKNRKIPCEYNVFTNATLIDDVFLNFAKKNNFTFYVSINGGNDEYKGKLFKKKIFQGIQRLKKQDLYVNARMVWVPNKTETLTDLVKDAVTNGVKAISLVLPWGMEYDTKIYKLFQEQFDEFVDFYLNQILKHNYKYVGIDPIASYISKWTLDKEYGDVSCGAGKNVSCIGTDGKCYPCHCFVNIADYVSGTVLDGSKPLFLDLAADTIQPCRDCEIRYFCKAKCLADAFYTHKDPYHMNEFKCMTEKVFVGASAYILSELLQRRGEFRAFQYIISNGSKKYTKDR